MKPKLKAKLYTAMENVYVKGVYSITALSTAKGAWQRVRRIGGGYKGSSKDFHDKVVAYWKPYGIHPKRFWYALYCNEEQGYDPRYIPDSLWYSKIIPYFNKVILRNAYADKCFYDRLFPDVKKPATVIKNISGHYYNGDNVPITRDEAVRLCTKQEKLIFKPSVESGEGHHIQVLEKDSINAEYIDKLLDEYGANYVVQQFVKQHPDLARINPSSLNTMRVISFFFKGEVHILSAQLRMGSAGSHVDNVGAGGCACAINPDGWLAEKSVTRTSQWSYEHPNGMKFKDIYVPSYDKVINTIKWMHTQLPYFCLVGWDFAVDAEGDPVFIELNINMAQNQIGCGRPTFGDMTEGVLEEVFIKKTILRDRPKG